MTETARLFTIFRIKYDRLASLLQEDNVDDVLELSAILRHFLINDPLADSLGQALGLPISLPLTDDSKRPSYGKIADFLNMEVGEYSVYKIVDAIANFGGGVHHTSKDSSQIEIFEKLVGSFDKNEGYLSLRKISERVLAGLRSIRDAIDRRVDGLEQRKMARQPLILGDRICFNGAQYLEGWNSIDLDNGFSLLISYALPRLFTNQECIVSVGNRKTGNEIALLRSGLKSLDAIMRIEGRVVGKLHMSGVNFLFSNVLCLIFQKSPDGSQNLELIGADGYRKSVPVRELSGIIEGKMVVGADLSGKRGAKFQAKDLAVFFDIVIGESDLKLLLNDFKEHLVEWVDFDAQAAQSFVRKIYNQGSSSK